MAEEKKGFWGRLVAGLNKTRNNIVPITALFILKVSDLPPRLAYCLPRADCPTEHNTFSEYKIGIILYLYLFFCPTAIGVSITFKAYSA